MRRRAIQALKAKRLETRVERNSVFWFAVFALFAVWAFWPSYFSRPFNQPHWRLHTHGIAMTLWCALLIMQAYLIRTGRKNLHRSLGKLSYVLAPFIVLATINLVHFTVRDSVTGPVSLYFLTLMLNAVLAFAVLFGLAIYHRRNAALHARYMVCTIFPLFTPVTDRLIFARLPNLTRLVPTIHGTPLVQILGFILADSLLAALVIWDRRGERRTHAFTFGLVMLVAYHASVLILYQAPAWKSFAIWFASLPLS